MRRGALSIEILAGGVLHSESISRVKGLEPFRVPSQPGIAMEKRPAVPPATTMWISSADGNFGTLRLPRTDVPSGSELPVNIAVGLQRPLTPAIHEWAVANPLLAHPLGPRATARAAGLRFYAWSVRH